MRPPKIADSEALIKIAEDTGIFKPGEPAELLGGILKEYHKGELGAGHTIEVLDDPATQSPLGWVYYSPSFKAEGVWDLWWIGLSPKHQGNGLGKIMLTHVESEVRLNGGRILIIETSSTEPLRTARACYSKMGYENCGQIPHFYGENDNKITFSKKL